MLPKINRLRKKQDFDRVFKKSITVKTGYFVFKAAKNDLGIKRVAFIVSQKVSKKAVIRNQIRRRLSAATNLEFKNIKEGADMVFIALPQIKEADSQKINKEVFSALNKARLLNKNV